ncbi:hypothetical protein ACLOJK_003579 [Asimina triloba]
MDRRSRDARLAVRLDVLLPAAMDFERALPELRRTRLPLGSAMGKKKETSDDAGMAAVDAMLLKMEGSPLRFPVARIAGRGWRRCCPIDLGTSFNI